MLDWKLVRFDPIEIQKNLFNLFQDLKDNLSDFSNKICFNVELLMKVVKHTS